MVQAMLASNVTHVTRARQDGTQRMARNVLFAARERTAELKELQIANLARRASFCMTRDIQKRRMNLPLAVNPVKWVRMHRHPQQVVRFAARIFTLLTNSRHLA